MSAGPIIDISQQLCDDVIGRQLPDWMQGVLSDVAGDAFTACPIGEPDPLGRPRPFATALRYTINTTITGTGIDIQGFVQANSPYAFFVHEGTQPHVIAAVNFPRLRFMKDGTVRRPKMVNHPGTAAQPFLRNALVTYVGATLNFTMAA